MQGYFSVKSKYPRIVQSYTKFPHEQCSGVSQRGILEANLIFYRYRNGKIFMAKNAYGKTGEVSTKMLLGFIMQEVENENLTK